MEFSVTKTQITTADNRFCATEEKSVELDVVLPDYCPDVAQILHCELVPTVSASGFNGDKLTADGVALLRVLYLDGQRRRVYTYEASQAFSAAFSVKSGQNEADAVVTAAADFVHCRAVSPRRLDIHGAVRVCAGVDALRETAVLDSVEDETVFYKPETVATAVLAGAAQKPFSVSETPTSADGVAAVLRSSAVPVTTDVKVLAGKVIVKGDLYVNALLCGEGDEPSLSEKQFVFPFSQMLDVAGTDETTVVDARVGVTSHSLRVEEDASGRVLYSNTKLLLSARAYREETATVLTDAYSTAMPLSAATEELTLCRPLAPLYEQLVCEQTLELPEDVSRVLSVWCDVKNAACKQPQERTLTAQLLVHLLAQTAGEQVTYYEREIEVETPLSSPGTDEEIEAAVIKTDVTGAKNGDLAVKVTLSLTRRPFERHRTTALTAITGDEAAAYPAEEAAVKLLYADEGETLWDVAKAAHTSVEALKTENELEADVLDKRTMLLVPLV